MLECKICGLQSNNLAKHITKTHNMTTAEYKKIYSVSIVVYITPETRKKAQQTKKLNGKYISPFNILYWINKGLTEDEAKYEISIRRPSNLNYWINKGLTEDEARIKLYNLSVSGSDLDLLIEKHGIERGTSLYEERMGNKRKQTPRCTEYWLSKGFTAEEAKIQISKIQNNTSLEKFVEKYGDVEGVQRRDELTKKWLNTLDSKSQEEKCRINKLKDRTSIKHVKENYGDDWINIYLQRNFSYHKNSYHYDLIKDCIHHCQNLDDFIQYCVKNISIIKDLKILLKNILIREIYNITELNVDYIFKDIASQLEIDDMQSGLFGTRITYKGILYKSQGEFQIAKYLEDFNINFSYDKIYPFQKTKWPRGIRYDFHITDINLYIELAGMIGMKSYDKQIQKKKIYCAKHSLFVYFSDNPNNIIDYINKRWQE